MHRSPLSPTLPKFSPRVVDLITKHRLNAFSNERLAKKRSEEEAKMIMHEWSMAKSRRTADYNLSSERKFDPCASR